MDLSPLSMVGFPVLGLRRLPMRRKGAVIDVADGLAGKGRKRVFVTSRQPKTAAAIEASFARKHPLDGSALTLIVSFYAMVERLASDLGIDPDHAEASEEGDGDGMSAELIAYLRRFDLRWSGDRYEDHALVVTRRLASTALLPNVRSAALALEKVDAGWRHAHALAMSICRSMAVMALCSTMSHRSPTLRREWRTPMRGLGATSILPTLITDTPDRTQAAIAAVQPGDRLKTCPASSACILKAPIFRWRRKGAHDKDLIRPMRRFRSGNAG